MIDKAQTELAKTLWEQSRTAAVQAHQAWDLVMKSQKSLMDSMRSAGAPFAMAADQFDKLMDFHSKQYKAALEYMDKMSEEYRKLLDQQKKK
ncbi:hypothetical protein [Ramlibacter albus]|uniref:Phasin family protein n=1 Tax=Ramlibacter albus TaxID=2079448 RepID=A0A923S443_9BURK|nr:hypothetical protein [Ramlibacter albus]MBC5766523.1 hypothetical protein [Ramlibacter albus]